MADFSTIFIDGDKKRIYEVPPDSSYEIDENGYRIYTPNDPPNAPKITYLNVQRDIWSRAIDHWADSNDWTYFPIIRSGGASRGFDAYGSEIFQSVDFNLKVTEGWKLVPADYVHTLYLEGNLFSNSPDDNITDIERLTTVSLVQVNSSDALLAYRYATGSGLSVDERAKLLSIPSETLTSGESAKLEMILEIYALYGLDPTKPLVVGKYSRQAGEILQSISTENEVTTVRRQL